MSQCRFAAACGIAQGVLSRWIAEIGAECAGAERPPVLVPVDVLDVIKEDMDASRRSTSIEIVVARDVTLRVSPGFDRAVLADVLAIVERRRC